MPITRQVSDRESEANLSEPATEDGAPTTDQDDEDSQAQEDSDDSVVSNVGAEEEDEEISNPSFDIQEDIRAILEGKRSQLKGDFATLCSYDVAPNPNLVVQGLSIGLPLNESTAVSLIKACTPAPYGKGKKTLVDKNVRDTWQVEPSQVKILNPGWAKWIKSTVTPQICESLGVDIKRAKPKAELYKLLLYQKGSHFLPHQDTEKEPGMFATLVVVLPSLFEGGSLHLTHSGETKVFDVANTSGYATHSVAWYTDVFHSVQPIKSGYRLALSYNFVHKSAPSLKPLLSDSSNQLRNILLTWRQGGGPEKLIYLFEHMYNEENLKSTSLKGKDAHIVRMLRGSAEKLHFRLCIVNLELHQIGQVENDPGPDYYDRDPYAESFGEDEDDEDEDSEEGSLGHKSRESSLRIASVDQSNWDISNAVDLDGNYIDLVEALNFDTEEEYLTRLLEETEAAEKDYEGYAGNHGGDLNVWYRRTALVIWPPERDFDVKIENPHLYVQRALAHLDKPTKRTKKLIRRLIRWGSDPGRNSSSHSAILGLLCDAAVRWDDSKMWLEACWAFGVESFVGVLGVSPFTRAAEKFGCKSLRKLLEGAFMKSRRDKDRLELWEAFLSLAKRMEDQESVAWIEPFGLRIVQSLQDADPGVIALLMPFIRDTGCSLAQDHIIPRLKRLNATPQYWDALGVALRANREQIPPDPQQVDALANSLTLQVLVQGEYFPPSVAPGSRREYGPLHNSKSVVTAWFRPIEPGLNIDAAAATRFFHGMKTCWDGFQPHDKRWMANNFLKEAMLTIDGFCRRQSPPCSPEDPRFAPFWKMALNAALDYMDNRGDYLFVAMRHCGGFDLVKNEFTVFFQRSCKTSAQSMQALALQALTAAAKHTTTQEKDAASLTALSRFIALNLVTHAPLEEPGRPIDIQLCLKLFQCLIICGTQESVEKLFSRIKGATTDLDVHKTIMTLSLPFAKACIQHLQSVNKQWPSTPLSEYCADAVWGLQERMVAEPHSLKKTPSPFRGCGCTECRQLQRLIDNGEVIVGIAAAQKIRTHLEGQLRNAQLTGYSWSTVKYRSPHTLQIHKPQRLAMENKWWEQRQEILTALAGLGELRTQRAIMGVRWAPLFGKLHPDVKTDRAASDTFAVPPICAGPLVTLRDGAKRPQPTQAAEVVSSTPRATNSVPIAIVSAHRPNPTTSSTQATKRTFDEAHGKLPTRNTHSKRVKSSKPVEIIELSD